MNIYIIIPAHNEAAFIEGTLQSLVNQSFLPGRIVVVDDHSTDNTASIVEGFVAQYPFISLVKNTSTDTHLPGSKVINAFYKGLNSLPADYDLLCKFDADLLFPKDYLKMLVKHFRQDEQIGMAGGFCHIEKNGNWSLEALTGKDHIRGALKAYRKECFEQIGGLKPSMGWDTVDELLAQYHGWKVLTDKALVVKHLKPTGFTYNKKAKLKQGEAFYKMRYGLIITFIASVKLAMNKRNISLLKDYLQGFFHARAKKMPFLVTKKEGAFIRRLRYKKMLSKLF